MEGDAGGTQPKSHASATMGLLLARSQRERWKAHAEGRHTLIEELRTRDSCLGHDDKIEIPAKGAGSRTMQVAIGLGGDISMSRASRTRVYIYHTTLIHPSTEQSRVVGIPIDATEDADRPIRN